MSDTFNDGIVKAATLFQAYTYPLYQEDENSLPKITASCVFLEVNKSTYLVTAAHAILGVTSGLLTRGKGRLIDVTGRATASSSDGGDLFDIAVICMKNEFISQNEINVIPEAMLVSNVEVEYPHCRAVCGFPASMNKQVKSLDRKSKRIQIKSYTFFQDSEFGGDFKEYKKSSETHIGMEFKSGRDDKGRVIPTPPWPPVGVSGGGAWLIPDISRPNLAFLEGIFIEGHKRAKKMYGFSTRIEYVVCFIELNA